MATTSFTHNFKLQNCYADAFAEGLTADNKPILDSNFKLVDSSEYQKVISAFNH